MMHENEGRRSFFSKRNRVYLYGGKVYKECMNEVAAREEYEILSLLHQKGMQVPKPLERHDNLVTMEYISGEALPDLLCEEGVDLAALARALVEWMGVFYAAVEHAESGWIRGDVNGRNFLVDSNGLVWGVDFESRVYGKMEQDGGRLLAFLESYDLPDPRTGEMLAENMAEALVLRLGMDPELLRTEREKELLAMKMRRGAKHRDEYENR